MPGLSDMEELLPRIRNKQITDYMREALACYNAAAYRACIVLFRWVPGCGEESFISIEVYAEGCQYAGVNRALPL